MRNYHKTGGKAGRPGYRTASMFRNKVLCIVSRIPRGKTLSYKKVAELAGSPRAYRAVGNILNKNYNPRIPCHRVIKSDGVPGGYNKGKREKIKKMKEEGYVFQNLAGNERKSF